jgi:hypothetical protein
VSAVERDQVLDLEWAAQPVLAVERDRVLEWAYQRPDKLLRQIDITSRQAEAI